MRVMASSEEAECDADAGMAGEIDTTYFASYEDLSVHELMLKDRPRTLAYKNFIEKNAALIEGKVVMDVGAGTGILSLFAAKAGAKKVYAVEGSKMSYTAALLANQNGYGEVIEVVHGRVEEADLPDDLQVDVMISEWMGFYLLHESMLDSLIVARDKWLSLDGIMVPSSVSLFICPVEMKEYRKEHFDYWSNVYGFDFSVLTPLLQHKVLTQPVVTQIEGKQLLAEPELVMNLDLQFVQQADVRLIRGSPNFQLTKNSLLHGFACWFDAEFEGEESVVLSTSPLAEPTHWQQTIIFLPDALLVSKGSSIGCHLELMQDTTQHRRYNITIQLKEEDEEEEDGDEGPDAVDEELLRLEEEAKERLLNALQAGNT